MGRQDAGAGRVPDQSFRVAGEGVGWKVCARKARRVPTKTVITARSISTTPDLRRIAPIEQYLTSIANAVDAFRKKRNVFVIHGRHRAPGCASGSRISEKLGGVPVLTSDEYNMYQLVSILRACHMMASSRYHGIVTSMPALVPSAGITMDERIRNLMRERGHTIC